MTRTERAKDYVDSLIGPGAIAFTTMRAGVDLGVQRPREWGQDVPGAVVRLGSTYAEYAITETLEHGFALGLHEDNRYFWSGKHGIAARLAYAASSTVLARHDDGSRSLSFSAIGGAASGALLARTWQPYSTTSLPDGAVSFGITMGIRLGMNIAREFSPRVMGRLLR